jgi:serine/threonine protein kinase
MQLRNYHVGAEIGRGGMARVHQAHDEKFDAVVAIKFLNREFAHNDNIRKRFLAEARSMFKMSHPNIVKVTDLIEDGDTVAFVMEFVEGETLKDFLDRRGPLQEKDIRAILLQMLDALAYVHEQGMVHRDVKPSNFMIDRKGKVRLMDFGIAKTLDSSSSEYTQTGTGMQMGTPMYMSPEQVRSSKEVGPASDIYSLGVVLWQMVMGRRPYDTSIISTVEMQIAILQESLPPTGSSWDFFISAATQKNAADRISSCSIWFNEVNQRNSNVHSAQHFAERTVSDSKQTHGNTKTESNEKSVQKKLTRTDSKTTRHSEGIKGDELPGGKMRWGLIALGVIAIIGLVSIGLWFTKKDQPAVSQEKHYEPEMISVAGGTFIMGSKNGADDAIPAHEVTLSSFEISKFEITQSQWQAVMNSNPSWNKCDNCPVEQVSWNDVQQYIEKLNSLTGKQYRLPTEAEWEFAAFGGIKSRKFTYSGSDQINEVAWYSANSSENSHAIGTKKANELGLFDMSGNVWEWCSDWYGSYSGASQSNPNGPSSGDTKVLRGGSFFNHAQFCRNYDRFKSEPDAKFKRFGFRLVSTATAKE